MIANGTRLLKLALGVVCCHGGVRAPPFLVKVLSGWFLVISEEVGLSQFLSLEYPYRFGYSRRGAIVTENPLNL